MRTIYSKPEGFGLEILGDIDFAEEYEFAIFAVFRDTGTGAILYGFDSGCSCPVPFESISRDDLEPLDSINYLRHLLSGYRTAYDRVDRGTACENLTERMRAYL